MQRQGQLGSEILVVLALPMPGDAKAGTTGLRDLVVPALPVPGDAKAGRTGRRDLSCACTADAQGCKGRDNRAQRP